VSTSKSHFLGSQERWRLLSTRLGSKPDGSRACDLLAAELSCLWGLCLARCCGCGSQCLDVCLKYSRARGFAFLEPISNENPLGLYDIDPFSIDTSLLRFLSKNPPHSSDHLHMKYTSPQFPARSHRLDSVHA
jgi:hypothetical protein